MSEEFIPYEEALALKELGFNEPCIAWYYGKDLWMVDQTESRPINYRKNPIRAGNGVLAPLYQQAFRWFRDEFQLIKQDYMFSQVEDYYAFIIYSSINGNIYDCCYNDKEEISGFGFKLYKESELACLEKLIEIVNQNKKDE